MRYLTELYINGTWRPGGSAGRVAVTDPADGAVLAEVARADIDDCIDAVESAAKALPGWAARAPRERADTLLRVFSLMMEEKNAIAEVIVRENGKAVADALAEVTYAAEFFRWFAEEAVRITGDYRVAPGGDKRIVVMRQPIGVCLLITPWNFPAAMATRKVAPALAAGCTVVVKPAMETPLTASYLVDLMERAGVPAGVVNLVTPDPPGEAVSAMLHHPAVRKLSFTGSTEVGRLLLHEAADRVVSCSLELGGNAPFLVFDDSDIPAAVEAAVVAKMRNGGAACTAANRFYVQRPVADAFAKQLAVAMSALTVGPGLDPSHQLGAAVSLAERDKVAALVDEAIDEGAIALTGAQIPIGVGAFYTPTVLINVRHGQRIVSGEIFGPVAPIIVFDEEDEAVDYANDTDAGLIAYVFSGELSRAMRVAARLDAGMVAVNRGLASDPAAPFGGVKQSGLGREGGFEGLQEFLEEKYLAVPL